MIDPNSQPKLNNSLFVEEAPSFDQMTELFDNLDVIQHSDPLVESKRRVLAVTEASQPGAAQAVIDSLKGAKERLLDTRPMSEKIQSRSTGDKEGGFIDYGKDFSPLPTNTDTQANTSNRLTSLQEDITAASNEAEVAHEPGLFAAALKRLAEKVPPLIPAYVGIPESTPPVVHTDEERAVIEYEDRFVAGTLRRLMRAAGVEEYPTPGVASSNIRLATIDLKVRAAEQNGELNSTVQNVGGE